MRSSAFTFGCIHTEKVLQSGGMSWKQSGKQKRTRDEIVVEGSSAVARFGSTTEHKPLGSQARGRWRLLDVDGSLEDTWVPYTDRPERG